jgi:hypothetical protein
MESGMKRRAHAKQRDINEPRIVKVLRAAGASVTLLDEPVDLLIGYRGCNFLADVKNPDGADRVTGKQTEFIATWVGQVAIVRTEAEALAVIGISTRWLRENGGADAI